MTDSLSASESSRSPWISDQGDGTYRNPVLFADYSDPDVVRVGDDFYMTASSFNCVPGLPILHSRDLVNWTLINHAIQRLPERFDVPQHGNGIWAPSIRFHDGWYWIFVGDPDWGILMTRTRDPAGEWSPLRVVKEGRGLIDPCPLWDDDDNAYLVHAWARSRAGINSILTVQRLQTDGSGVFGEEVLAFDGRNGVAPTIEGPKFYKRGAWYYILAPAGGVAPGWQLALRARSPFGPYEAKRVLEQGSTDINGPHQGGWVELANGENWFMHFQDRGAYGRLVHLNPVHWVDDWPMMGIDRDGNGVGEPVTVYQKPKVSGAAPLEVPATSDAFDADAPGLQWQWQANPQAGWASTRVRAGWLRLSAVRSPENDPRLWNVPNLLLQKFPAPAFTSTTKVEISPVDGDTKLRAGLVVMGQNYAALELRRLPAGLALRVVRAADAMQGGEETTPPVAGKITTPIWLRVTIEPGAVCRFSYSTNGVEYTTVGEPFTAREGRWIGAKVGLYCLGTEGHADFDWFRIE